MFDLNAVKNPSPEDVEFRRLVDVTSPGYDKAAAKAYGLANWGELSEESRGAWDWTFGREARLPAWACRRLY